jgi:hypothetical protein
MDPAVTAALAVRRAAELVSVPDEQRWMIRPIWLRSAAGVLGGHPKAGKTWMGLDMAVSVASGTACLRRFPVEDPGPALVYLAEDDEPLVRRRLESICASRAISIDSLALHVITEPVLRLDQEEDQHRLVDAVERLRPRLLVLDPLIRLHRLDENSASEISGLLGYFREVQRRFDCAIVIVHHVSKKARAMPGQALRGSSDLHAFGTSNAYLGRADGDRLVLQLEHRAARAPDAISLRLADEDDRRVHLEVAGAVAVLRDEVPVALTEGALLALREQGPLTRQALRERLRVNNQRLGDALEHLEHRGQIVRVDRGWTLVECAAADDRHVDVVTA